MSAHVNVLRCLVTLFYPGTRALGFAVKVGSSLAVLPIASIYLVENPAKKRTIFGVSLDLFGGDAHIRLQPAALSGPGCLLEATGYHKGITVRDDEPQTSAQPQRGSPPMPSVTPVEPHFNVSVQPFLVALSLR